MRVKITPDMLRREWFKFIIHGQRHPNRNVEKMIRDAIEWCEDNISDDYMIYVVAYHDCAIFYIAEEEAAMLFQLANIFHARDCRGRGVWA